VCGTYVDVDRFGTSVSRSDLTVSGSLLGLLAAAAAAHDACTGSVELRHTKIKMKY
jgi:hypothetical protein